MTSKKWRVTLTLKLMFWFLCFSVIPIVTISYLSFRGAEEHFQNTLLGSLEGLAQVKNQAIKNFVNDRLLEIQKFATMPSVALPATAMNRSLEARKALEEKKASIEAAAVEVPPPPTDGQLPPNASASEPIKPTPQAEGTPSPTPPATDDTAKATSPPEAKDTKDTVSEAPTHAEEGIFQEVDISAAGAVKAELQKKKSSVYESLNKQLELILGPGGKYEEIFVLDLAGMVAVSTFYGNEGKSAATSDFFLQGQKTTYIQNIFVSEITKKLSMVIATPVKDEIGKVVAVLGARLNLDTFYKLIQDEKGLGKTGETVVAKKMGESVVFMAPTRYDDTAALNRTIDLGSGLSFPVQEAARGRNGMGVFPDYRNIRCFAAWQAIPILDWGISVKIDAAEALQPVLDIRNNIIVLTLALLVLCVFLSTFISRGIVSPIRELTAAANSISKGDLNVKIPVRTKDEVGDLADSFDRMVAAIRFLKEKHRDTDQKDA